MAIINVTGLLSGMVGFQLDFDDVALQMIRYKIDSRANVKTIFKLQTVEQEFDENKLTDITIPVKQRPDITIETRKRGETEYQHIAGVEWSIRMDAPVKKAVGQ